MQSDALFIFRVICSLGLAITLLVGFLLAQNYQKLFGSSSDMPSENGSSRTYAQTLVFLAWAHAFVLFTTGVLALH